VSRAIYLDQCQLRHGQIVRAAHVRDQFVSHGYSIPTCCAAPVDQGPTVAQSALDLVSERNNAMLFAVLVVRLRASFPVACGVYLKALLAGRVVLTPH